MVRIPIKPPKVNVNTKEAPDFNKFYSEPIHVQNLASFKEIDEELEMLKGESERMDTGN